MVRTCSSFKGARETMAKWSVRKMRPDFIVSPIQGRDGDGISFFLDAKRRFPDARWIISDARVESNQVEPLAVPSDWIRAHR